MVICLERGADLHTAQLMPLPLTVSCSSKIQIGFTFLAPAHPGSPGKRAVKQVCVPQLQYCTVRHYVTGVRHSSRSNFAEIFGVGIRQLGLLNNQQATINVKTGMPPFGILANHKLKMCHNSIKKILIQKITQNN